MGGISGATGAPGGVTSNVSPYQQVDTAALNDSSFMRVDSDPSQMPIDVNDPFAVLHAQLDYYEKYRGGVVLGNYRCVAALISAQINWPTRCCFAAWVADASKMRLTIHTLPQLSSAVLGTTPGMCGCAGCRRTDATAHMQTGKPEAHC